MEKQITISLGAARAMYNETKFISSGTATVDMLLHNFTLEELEGKLDRALKNICGIIGEGPVADPVRDIVRESYNLGVKDASEKAWGFAVGPKHPKKEFEFIANNRYQISAMCAIGNNMFKVETPEIKDEIIKLLIP